MSTIEYSCGHQVSAHSGQGMPMQCACGMGEIVGAKGQFYMDDPVRANLRGAMMNATQLNAVPITSEPKPTEEQLGAPDWTKAHKDATHWDRHMWRFCSEFGYFESTGEFVLLDTHRWGTDRYVERPTGRDGEGLPPVGTECEAVWLEMPDGGDRDFERVIVKGYWEKQVWFCAASGEDFTHLLANVDFLPVRTQAQRERDDLLTSIIEDYRTSFNSPVSTVELNLISEFANYLFEIGMLRSAGE